MRSVIVSILLCAGASIAWAEYPANFPKCKNSDSSCFVQAANQILRNNYGGVRDVNLIPFDPLHVKSLSLDNKNPGAPVNVELKFKDMDVYGLKDMQVKSFTGLSADLSGRTVLELVVPEMIFKGFYKMDGHILILPMVGEGACEVIMKNVKVKFSTDLKPVEKNGQTYAVLEHVKLELDPGYVHFDFKNIFSGGEAVSESTHKVINDNWQEVFGEIKGNFQKGLGLIVKTLINSFFDKYPYADYFL